VGTVAKKENEKRKEMKKIAFRVLGLGFRVGFRVRIRV